MEEDNKHKKYILFLVENKAITCFYIFFSFIFILYHIVFWLCVRILCLLDGVLDLDHALEWADQILHQKLCVCGSCCFVATTRPCRPAKERDRLAHSLGGGGVGHFGLGLELVVDGLGRVRELDLGELLEARVAAIHDLGVGPAAVEGNDQFVGVRRCSVAVILGLVKAVLAMVS